MQRQQLNVILVGKTGSGKSASGNTILGRKIFVSKISATSVTKDITSRNVTIGEVSLTVYDTPALFDTGRGNEEVGHQWNPVLQLEQSSLTVFLLVIKPDRFTEEERKSVHDIETFLGKSRLKNTWMLFTRGDELEEDGITLEDFIADIPELKKTVQRFEGRYHIFNNKAMGNREQVGRLIEKIQKGHYFTTPHQPSSLPERRLMLLGKTGVGKSASGNTILGRDVFKSAMNFKSVTYESKRGQSVVAGGQVSVVDTPGLFDTQLTQDEMAVELGRAVYDSSPGVHAFLITLQVSRFTAQEKQVIDLIKELCGEGALKYTLILFTHGDQLEGTDIHPLIKDCKDLSDLVQQCGGRYHVFNNKDRRNTGQVTALLDKIDRMVEENGGSYYTNQMFQDAKKRRTGFTQFFARHRKKLMAAGVLGSTGVCAGIGTAIGIVGGPAGMAIGAGVGALVGVVGAAVGAAVVSKREDKVPLCKEDHLEMQHRLLNE